MIETIRGPRAAGPPRGGKTTMNERDGIEPFEDGASSDRIEGFLVTGKLDVVELAPQDRDEDGRSREGEFVVACASTVTAPVWTATEWATTHGTRTGLVRCPYSSGIAVRGWNTRGRPPIR